jgi:5-methyltetrahydrofolate--homocysteine methyltransferase
METVLRSATREVRIGPGFPFVIIGERINPTNRKALAAEMLAGNFDRVRNDALAQVAAGARMLDVNAGIPIGDEPAILAEAVRVVQETVEVPLSIDSSMITALEAGLSAVRGKALVNSVTGESEKLERVLPVVAAHGAAVIAISHDERGISEDIGIRFEVAKRIVERAGSYGIPPEDVLIDPLVMPAGVVRGSGRAVADLARRIHEELGCNTVCGASNVSMGLPDRPSLNAAFIAMLIGAGMPSAIINPLEELVRKAVLAADVLVGHDEDCMAWLMTIRKERAAAAAALAATGAPEVAATR